MAGSLVWLTLGAALASAPGSSGTLVRATAGPTTIARGETLEIPVESRLRELPHGDLDGRVTPTVRGGGLSVVGWTETIEVRPGKKGSTVHSHLLVRADVGAPLGVARVGARIDVFDADMSRPVAVLVFDGALTVVRPAPSEASVDRALADFRGEQARAEQGARLVPEAGAPLRLDRLEMPPRGPAFTGTDRLALKAFLSSRLRADVAREHLRAAATLTSTTPAARAVIERAVRALASLSDPPPRAGTPAPPPLKDPLRAVEQGLAYFDRLELDLAQRTLQRARLTPALPAARLPEVLIRLGAIEAARGDEAAATRLIGQATCLAPERPAPTDRPPMAEAIAAVRARGRCPRALAFHSVTAAALEGADEPSVRVRVLFGPDPYHAIARGAVELLDPAGGVRASRELAVERGDLAALDAVFSALEVGAPEGDAVTVRARVFDEEGRELARLEATRAPLVVEATPDRDGIAWWVWVVGGAAVVAAGATTAALVAGGGGTPTRTIAPIGVTF